MIPGAGNCCKEAFFNIHRSQSTLPAPGDQRSCLEVRKQRMVFYGCRHVLLESRGLRLRQGQPMESTKVLEKFSPDLSALDPLRVSGSGEFPAALSPSLRPAETPYGHRAKATEA